MQSKLIGITSLWMLASTASATPGHDHAASASTLTHALYALAIAAAFVGAGYCIKQIAAKKNNLK